MSLSQIANISPNYRDYKNWWIKAYEPGTTTPKPMFADIDGGGETAKFKINKDGFFVSSGSAIVIPFIDGSYDIYAFPTEAKANANDTSNAERWTDNISPPGSNIGGYATYEFDTVANAKNGVTIGGNTVELEVNDVVRIKERNSALFDVISGTGTANTYNIIAHNTLDLSFQLRKRGDINVKEVGALGDGVDDLGAFDAATAMLDKTLGGTILVPNDGENVDYLLSDSWNVIDYDNVTLHIERGATVRTDGPTTYGHTLAIVAGNLFPGGVKDRVENVAIVGGGTIRTEGSAGADNSIGMLRCYNYLIQDMYIPVSDRKAITNQVNDPTGDPNKFNGNGRILNNKIGTTGLYGISIEGGHEGDLIIDGNTADLTGGDFIHLTGSASPSVSIEAATLGINQCKQSNGKGIYAFKVISLDTGQTDIELSEERGIDLVQCVNASISSEVTSNSSWGCRISQCSGTLSITDRANIKTLDSGFNDLDLQSNTNRVAISAARIGDGTAAFAINAVGSSWTLSGTKLGASTPLFNGLDGDGFYFVGTIPFDIQSGVQVQVYHNNSQFADGDSTPSVSLGNVFTTGNTAATDITNFTNGYNGKEITIVFNDVLTTIKEGTSIKLAGSVDYTPTSGNDTLKLVRSFNTWYEVSRSDN